MAANPDSPQRIVYPGSNSRLINSMNCINHSPNFAAADGHAQSRRRPSIFSTALFNGEVITIDAYPVRTGTKETARLSKEEISRFLETSIYEKAAAADGGVGDPELCAVCQETYQEMQKVGVLGCRHRFHADCIGEWLLIKNACPLCNCAVKLV